MDHDATRTSTGPQKLVIRNIGLLLTGAMEEPIRDADTIVVLNVDQPRPAALIRELLDAHQPSFAVTRPEHDGHGGHPVVVSGWLRDEMLQATDEDQGLRGILRRHMDAVQRVPAGPDCLVDLNTVEDYREARAAASGRSD